MSNVLNVESVAKQLIRTRMYGIANSFEVYSGTHTSAVADRFQNHVLPFFSKNLCVEAGCH